jgi:DNA ligase-1
MANREFLQLAQNYNPIRHGIGGWFASEKLDGMRAYWDGGISRGILTSQIKYANTAKDYRRLTPVRATGLWTRYAKPIAAPNWWLDLLPANVPLDGELYMGHGKFQELVSCVKKLEPGPEWHSVCYMVFDVPSDYMMFAPGRIFL